MAKQEPINADPSRSTPNAPIQTAPLIRQIGQAAAVLLLVGVSYWFIGHFFLQTVRVSGKSMLPTLHDSQSYLLNRWIYYLREPKREDVVVLRDPADNGFSVKRIIACSGESVSLKDGAVFVNGTKLSEPYLHPGTSTYPFGKIQDQSVRCGKDQYFVLGDNRSNSADSRGYGPIPRQNILGLVVH